MCHDPVKYFIERTPFRKLLREHGIRKPCIIYRSLLLSETSVQLRSAFREERVFLSRGSFSCEEIKGTRTSLIPSERSERSESYPVGRNRAFSPNERIYMLPVWQTWLDKSRRVNSIGSFKSPFGLTSPFETRGFISYTSPFYPP